jgi:hypothetical protein
MDIRPSVVRICRALGGVAVLGLLASAQAAQGDAQDVGPAGHPAVEVDFIHPESFTDAGISRGVQTDKPKDVLNALKAHLQSLGQRCLAPGQTLSIRVTDVRLAGDVEWPMRRFADQPVRVLRDVTWPSVDLEFVLKDTDGRLLQQATDHVSDPAYLQGGHYVRSGLDQWPYEKNMLSRWYEQRFCAAQRSG